MDSPLKSQFPLSPKKFWKKIIEKVLVAVLIAVALAIPIFIMYIESSNPIPFALVTGAVVVILVLAIYAIYVHYYIKTYYYADDGNFITIKKGVFAPAEIHVQYLKIQDVYVDQDILDRIMGLYDVHISSATYTSGIEAHIDGVEKMAADGLKELLLGKIRTAGHGNSGGSAPYRAQSQAIGTTDLNTTGREGAPASPAPVKAHFSSPISSSVYGLSKDWWMSEISKMAVSAVIMPAIITLWLGFGRDRTPADIPFLFWIWLAILIIYIAYRVIYLWLWKSHYSYNFGEEFIYMKLGVLSVSEKNMAYNTIQDVKIHQTFIDRLFGVADLIIENASQIGMIPQRRGQVVPQNGIVIEGLSLADAKRIADEVKSVVITKAQITKGL
jgi:membrane protein YdbS with pleckstrin-like domain